MLLIGCMKQFLCDIERKKCATMLKVPKCYLKANLVKFYSFHAKNLNFLAYIWSLPVFPKGEKLECEYSSGLYLLYETATSN